MYVDLLSFTEKRDDFKIGFLEMRTHPLFA